MFWTNFNLKITSFFPFTKTESDKQQVSFESSSKQSNLLWINILWIEKLQLITLTHQYLHISTLLNCLTYNSFSSIVLTTEALLAIVSSCLLQRINTGTDDSASSANNVYMKLKIVERYPNFSTSNCVSLLCHIADVLLNGRAIHHKHQPPSVVLELVQELAPQSLMARCVNDPGKTLQKR